MHLWTTQKTTTGLTFLFLPCKPEYFYQKPIKVMLSIKNRLLNTTSQMFQVDNAKIGNQVATKELFFECANKNRCLMCKTQCSGLMWCLSMWEGGTLLMVQQSLHPFYGLECFSTSSTNAAQLISLWTKLIFLGREINPTGLCHHAAEITEIL